MVLFNLYDDWPFHHFIVYYILHFPYLTMPEEYWNNKMSLEQIFYELGSHKSQVVKEAARNPVNVIQQYVILDDIPGLMKHAQILLEDRWNACHLVNATN